MTDYVKIENIKDLGGYVVPIISPFERLDWDSADSILGHVNELTLVNNSLASTANPIFILPEITKLGQVCGVKNISDIALPNFINVVPSPNDGMFAGISNSNIANQVADSCIFAGNVGECVYFISGLNVDTFPETPSGYSWILISYLEGSVVAP